MVSLMKRRSASLAKECPHGVLDIALKCHLGHTRSLEILPIKIGGPSIPKCPQGAPGISAKSAASLIEVEVRARTASTLSSFACGVSSRTNPAARSI